MAMLREPVHHLGMYGWYLLLASLDVLLTWVILRHGGYEANALAAWVIERSGMRGATFFKFATVAFVLVMCEVIARRDQQAAKLVAGSAIALNLLPVLVSVGMISHLVAMGVQISL